MVSSRIIPLSTRIILLCLLSSFFFGCAQKRWLEPLTEEEQAGFPSLLSTMQEADKTCRDSLDADARIYWTSPLSDIAIIGYLQLASPSFVKYIITNPLGMMVYAFASDGDTFQILDTSKHQHIRGNVRTLAIRQKLPLIFAEGDWYSYLTGRLPVYPLAIQTVNRDTTDQSVWLLLEPSATSKTDDKRWLHVDPTQQKLLGYLFIDKDGKTVAEISYEEDTSKDACTPKETISFTDLPWGVEIRVELQDISTETELMPIDFILPVPADYYRQIQP